MSYRSLTADLLFMALSLSAIATDNDDSFVPIFDGKTLDGWRAVPEDSQRDWSVRDGVIVGTGSKKRLAYLVWKEELGDFELKFSYRMVTEGNSGIEVRARVDKSGKRPFEGYHADLGHVGIGRGVLGAWDFHFAKRREPPCLRGTRLFIAKNGQTRTEKIKGAVTPADIKKHGWNDVHVIAKGRKLWFSINGKPAAEFTDAFQGASRHDRGMIGLQLHDKGMTVEFRGLRVKKL